MTLVVVAAPVPPDKVEQHRRMLDELHGSRRAQYEAIHRQAGVRERGYMQHTPAGGYLYLIAWEGEGDPAALFQRLVQAGQADADFAQWFFPQRQAVHGIEVSQGLPPRCPPRSSTLGRCKGPRYACAPLAAAAPPERPAPAQGRGQRLPRASRTVRSASATSACRR